MSIYDHISAPPVVDLAQYREDKARREWEAYVRGLPKDERRRYRARSRDNPTKARAELFQLFRGYRPHAKQIQLHLAGTRFLVACAGRRSGKTYAMGREFLRRVYHDLAEARRRGKRWEHPGKLGPETKPALWYWCVAPTYQLGTYQRQEIFEILGGPDGPLVMEYRRQENTLWLEGGIKIEFRSAERPNGLVGSGLDGIWIDEAARLKRRAWDDNLRGTLSDKEGWAIFSSTPLGQNWFYTELWQKTQAGTDAEQRNPDWFGIHWTSADNTALPHLVAEAAAAKRDLPLPIYLRNYEASFTAFEGKIFENFMDTGAHVLDRVPFHLIRRKIAGVDWGFGNPGVQLEIGIGGNGEMYVYREDYQARLPVTPPGGDYSRASWVGRFKGAQMRGVETWWADPSGAGYIEQCRREGIRIKAALNSVAEGIDAVAAMLTPTDQGGGIVRPALFIHKNCVNLRRELLTYHYQDGDTERPAKVDDHAVDALRYAVYSEHLRGPGEGLAPLKKYASMFNPSARAAA